MIAGQLLDVVCVCVCVLCGETCCVVSWFATLFSFNTQHARTRTHTHTHRERERAESREQGIEIKEKRYVDHLLAPHTRAKCMRGSFSLRIY